MDYTELMRKYISQDDIYLYNTGCARKAWPDASAHTS